MKLPIYGPRLRKVARTHFGWPSLRPGQFKPMRAVLRRRDALVVLPTGAGKSAIYQIPAVLLPGPTVVISPLLALQQDQIAALNERADAKVRAVRVSSAETPREQQEAIEELRAGRAEFLFITPEQLANPERLAEVKSLKPGLVAIDEAHCISAWGPDFRPDFLALGDMIEQLGRPPVLALTATASPPVREDIIARLRLRDPEIHVSGLDRPNLFLEVTHCPDEAYRWRRLTALLDEGQRPGIIYVPTRRAAEELAEKLTGAGYPAEFYHGGMAAGLRQQRHEDFIDDKVDIMVATSAFGMGIDKPNIRWVAHTALPDSPDSYFQEIGRAGRDGEPGRVLLLWRAEDEAIQRFFNGGGPDPDELRELAGVLHKGPITKTALQKETGLGPRRLGQYLALLEQAGAVRTGKNSKLRVPAGAPLPAKAAEAAVAEFERQQAVIKSRTDMMRAFAESRQCRTETLLAYFGEEIRRTCNHCDNCADGSAEAVNAAEEEGPFPIHSQVRHGEWGTGMVMGYEEEKMTVLFDTVGYKTLSVPVVVQQQLLTGEASAAEKRMK
ncbi:ATP-dependent DNA helicase [Actinoplanes sp. SE50]|uniref:RecQ family ATP-dependent DNA helicase n=1 Tax=unclassified Actinoplanes TaxID=2626549 RepID=UPI00023EBE16|nr:MULTISPECIES: RecQ family ATP-dependent DNA helicase [unclassified Actinoplanes]AEV87453.1 ATP-dependent DNA helicase RecQ [Actinoplanes sp. SE50/110]ATO85855.1 ATP-dependent DNA helicase [Actinoplanes sp. SE50]SLM03269.1 ATP-dependent DNA helicase [Actinoplanes sp. SE50/110]